MVLENPLTFPCFLLYNSKALWRDVRAAEGAALEMLCAPQAYRGFKSPSLRHQRDVGSNNWVQRHFDFMQNKSLNPLRTSPPIMNQNKAHIFIGVGFVFCY